MVNKVLVKESDGAKHSIHVVVLGGCRGQLVVFQVFAAWGNSRRVHKVLGLLLLASAREILLRLGIDDMNVLLMSALLRDCLVAPTAQLSIKFSS